MLFTAFTLSGLFLSAVAQSCSCLADAVSSISTDALGAAFCSQYVSTVWDSTTITTPLATTIIADTVVAEITITTAVLELRSTTTTLTETLHSILSTATAIVTSLTTVCYSGTSFGLVAVTPAARAVEQRQIIPTALPTLYLASPPSIISIEDSLVVPACKCFLGSSATVTSTLTDFVGSGTGRLYDHSNYNRNSYTDLVTTWTDIFTTASEATSTTTITSTSYTPVPPGTQLGLNWYYYVDPYSFESGADVFSAAYFNNPNYNFSGYIENVGNFHTGVTYSTSNTDYTCNVAADEDCEYVGIILQRYLWAADGPGDYTLLCSDGSDNAFLVWHGTNAYDNYTKSNYDYLAEYPRYSGSVTIDVATGELVPVTMLWLNGGGPGQALLSITNPAGTTTANSTGFFVPANVTCSGYADPFSP